MAWDRRFLGFLDRNWLQEFSQTVTGYARISTSYLFSRASGRAAALSFDEGAQYDFCQIIRKIHPNLMPKALARLSTKLQQTRANILIIIDLR